MLQRSNEREKKYANDIVTQIQNYENQNNERIEKIAIYFDGETNPTFDSFPNNSFTIKSVYTSYARMDFLYYYLKNNLEIIRQNNKYIEYFHNKSWNEFNKEQMIFENEILHLCIF